MKPTNLFLFWTTMSVLFISGCNETDKEPVLLMERIIAPAVVLDAFTEKFPSVKNVRWETVSNYYSANFTHDNFETIVWFDDSGVWHATVTELPFKLLPETTQNRFNESEYSSWEIGNVIRLERKDTKLIYIINIQSNKRQRKLYYTTDGVFIKAEFEKENNTYIYFPQPFPIELTAFIVEKYREAGIVDIKYKDNKINIDIIHDEKTKTVVFDVHNQWCYTSYNKDIELLPQRIVEAVNYPQYEGFRIINAVVFEEPEIKNYLLELEKGDNGEKTIVIIIDIFL